MPRVRYPLYLKIMIWFLFNLVVLAGVFALIFGLNFRFERSSPFFFSVNRLETLSRQITNETQDMTREQRDAVIARLGESWGVTVYIFADDGRQIAGPSAELPPEIASRLTGFRMPLPTRDNGGLPAPPPAGPRPMFPVFYTYTRNPTLYWSGAPAFMFVNESPEPVRARLVASSGSITGNGLFFNPWPWIWTILIVLVVSALVWLPFVRGLTRQVASMNDAARKIANEDFAVRVSEDRNDELGTLGASINHLAARLEGFVSGQKRFLGDVSHELNTPLARMQFALGILEGRVAEKDIESVNDVREEVEIMSKLVSELLAFSKTGIKAQKVEVESTRLRPLIDAAVGRETLRGVNSEIIVEAADDVTALVHPEMFARALGNVVRNAVRYAGEAGPISISVKTVGDRVEVTVADCGEGVPDEALDRLFDPFYRVESHRSRESGGTGLGLAIVRTCVEALRGKVRAENLAPRGFAVTMEFERG